MRKTIRAFSILGIVLSGIFLIVTLGGLTIADKKLSPKVSYEVTTNGGTVEPEWVKENKKEAIEQQVYSQEITELTSERQAEVLKMKNQNISKRMIGNIVFPDSNITLPILAGPTDANMLQGAATVSENQQLGKSNYVVVSHSNPFGSLSPMQDLPSVKMNDLVLTTDFQKIYTYKVTFSGVVHETDVAYIAEPKENELPLLTLYRCEGRILHSDYRYLVQAQFVGEEEIKTATKSVLTVLNVAYNPNTNNTENQVEMKNDSLRKATLAVEWISTEASINHQYLIFAIVVAGLSVLGLVFTYERK